MEKGDDPPERVVASAETAALSLGDRIFHRFFKKSGIIRIVEGETAVLEIEGKTVRSPLRQLERRPDPGPPLSSLRNVTRDVREDTNPELNLIGRPAAEAVAEADKFLGRALVSGLAQIRLIHGIGTDLLKHALAELLDGHPHVKKFQVEEAPPP